MDSQLVLNSLGSEDGLELLILRLQSPTDETAVTQATAPCSAGLLYLSMQGFCDGVSFCPRSLYLTFSLRLLDLNSGSSYADSLFSGLVH